MRTLLPAVALFAGVAVFTPAAADAAPVAQTTAVRHQSGPALHTGPINTQASFSCSYLWTPQRVDAYCNVYSGYVRFFVRCSDGRSFTTPWLTGPNQYIWFDCSPASVASISYQTAG